jgi:hypothetical protein
VAEADRAETAEEVEDFASVPIDVVHPLGALDQHAVKPEQLHEMQLPRVQMPIEQIRRLGNAQTLGLLDTQQVRMGQPVGAFAHDVSLP